MHLVLQRESPTDVGVQYHIYTTNDTVTEQSVLHLVVIRYNIMKQERTITYQEAVMLGYTGTPQE